MFECKRGGQCGREVRQVVGTQALWATERIVTISLTEMRTRGRVEEEE